MKLCLILHNHQTFHSVIVTSSSIFTTSCERSASQKTQLSRMSSRSLSPNPIQPNPTPDFCDNEMNALYLVGKSVFILMEVLSISEV